MQTTKEEISVFVQWFFDTNNANRSAIEQVYPPGKRFISRCLGLSCAEKCPEFIVAVERLLHDLLGPRGLVSNDYHNNALDRAWYLHVLDQEVHVWYIVVVSALLPIITVRATTDHVGEGPDSRWVLPSPETPLLKVIRDNVNRLAAQITPLAKSHGYMYISWDDEAFQQTIMFKYFTGRWSRVDAVPIKAWDFLVYTDIEDEEG